MQAVADAASRFLGTSIGQDAIIDESLERATDDSLAVEDVRPQLAGVLTSTLPDGLTDETLKRHPLAVWVELAIGLDDAQELKRKKPVPFNEAVSLLSKDSGVDPKICEDSLERFLTHVGLPEKDRGGAGTGAFLAFKLHQFISGAGEMFTTLTISRAMCFSKASLRTPVPLGTGCIQLAFAENAATRFTSS